jgi:preprotein translocase subunit YajC
LPCGFRAASPSRRPAFSNAGPREEPQRRERVVRGRLARCRCRPARRGGRVNLEEYPVLISPAFAQAAPAASQTDSLLTFLPMVAIFVVFYFLLIRPQQKKQKEARAMLESLNKGDEVVTAGGVVGRISKLSDQYATIEIAPNTEMVVQRGAIAQLLPKGTIKAI